MKYEITKPEGTGTAEIRIVFAGEEYDERYEKELAAKMSQAEAPGFRKGKLPRGLYLRKFGDAGVRSDTETGLIGDAYAEIIKKEKLDVIYRPKLEILTDINDREWGVKITVSLFPSLTVKDYYGITAVKEEPKVTDHDLDEEKELFRYRNADLELSEDKSLEKGDTAVFDFCGYIDGKEFEGGKGENTELEIGSGRFIPGFEEQMIGMKTGEEKTLNVVFPDNYHKDLSGKKAEFKVKLHEIKVLKLPEWNDDFIKSLDLGNIDTTEKWRKDTYDRKMKEKTEKIEDDYRKKIIRKLRENNPLVIPEVMIEEEIAGRLEETERISKEYKITTEDFLRYNGFEGIEEFKKKIRPDVIAKIETDIILGAVAEREKITLNDEDYDIYYRRMIAEGNPGRMSLEDVRKKYPKQSIAGYFLLKKTLDKIMEHSKSISEVTVSEVKYE